MGGSGRGGHSGIAGLSRGFARSGVNKILALDMSVFAGISQSPKIESS